MEQKSNELLLMEDVLRLSPARKLADAIMQLITKDQLNTLKSRLQFNPRKLPLTTPALTDALRQGGKATFELLYHRYSQIIDAFEMLVLPEQLKVLRGYAQFVSEQFQQANNESNNDYEIDQLEELDALLHLFLENVENRHNRPHSQPVI